MKLRRFLIGAALATGVVLIGLILFVAWRLTYAIPEITEAVIAGDVVRVRQLLDGGTDPNTTAPFLMLLGRDPERAKSYRREETLAGVFYLGQQQAIILTASCGQWAPTNWEIVDLILDYNVELTTEDAWYTFCFALHSHHFDITDKMLAKGFQVDRSEGRVIGPPLRAVTKGNLKACEYLLSNGAGIESLFYRGPVKLFDGTTKEVANALFISPQTNEAEIYCLLVKHGLPLHLRHDRFATMLHAAVWMEDVWLATYLIESGFDVDCRPEGAVSALELARHRQYPPMIDFLEAATAQRATIGNTVIAQP